MQPQDGNTPIGTVTGHEQVDLSGLGIGCGGANDDASYSRTADSFGVKKLRLADLRGIEEPDSFLPGLNIQDLETSGDAIYRRNGGNTGRQQEEAAWEVSAEKIFGPLASGGGGRPFASYPHVTLCCGFQQTAIGERHQGGDGHLVSCRSPLAVGVIRDDFLVWDTVRNVAQAVGADGECMDISVSDSDVAAPSAIGIRDGDHTVFPRRGWAEQKIKFPGLRLRGMDTKASSGVLGRERSPQIESTRRPEGFRRG